MELWIGPAIVAAFVSALVSALGWFVTSWQARREDERQRDEKIHDFQVALRAEIGSDYLNMVVFDRTRLLAEISRSYDEDENYSVIVPHMATNVIFNAIVAEIHLLPEAVITPIVDYARLRQTLERFVLDMRADGFPRLTADRQLAMYSDYLDTLDRLEALAQSAIAALNLSLGISSPDAVPSSRGAVAAPAGADAGGSAS